MFTRQTLRRLANANSFERGESYYDEGSVEKLRREGDGFAATVRGSRAYRVTLRLAAAGPAFSCTCPYALDGICKHMVALGLAVLDAYDVSQPSPTPPAATRPGTPPPLTDKALALAVKAAWADRKKGDKLRFLKQALTKSDDLARHFLGYGNQSLAAPAATAIDVLADLPERLTDTLTTLEFDEEFWENSEGYDDDDEGDGMYAEALEVIREALAPFVAELLRLARGGQLTLALRYWAAACEAIYQVEEPGSDEFGMFGDYGEDVLSEWYQALAAAGWPAGLLAAVLPPAELAAALAWLGTYLANPPAHWPGFEASWLPLLLVLAADAGAAPRLLPALEAAALSPDALARLRLQTARTLADDTAWAATAETLLPTDADVARQLLHHYRAQGDLPARLRVAAVAFTTWPDQFGDYVLGNFAVDQAPGLYRDALRHRALANQNLDDFTRLRPLLDAAEIAGFVQTAVAMAKARRGSFAFAAELLARESEAAALREFVLGLEWLFVSPAPQLDRALTLLAEADPTALMLELEARTRAYLTGRADARRGAGLYQAIARWLALVRRVAPRLTEPALRLAADLRAEFPTLHGLKDALRGAGLLPDAGPPVSGKKSGKR